MLTYGSTFSGVGGLDLAVEHVFGARPAWHVEPNPYAAAVLRKHWPDVPNLERVELIDANTPRTDIICGGFPCQDISTAGKGEGIHGARSGLWWELARAIGLLRPRIVVLENVAALLTRGLVDVLGELARLGFDAEWSTLRASDVGAPHRRNRSSWPTPLAHSGEGRKRQGGMCLTDKLAQWSTPTSADAASTGTTRRAATRGRPSRTGWPSTMASSPGRYAGVGAVAWSSTRTSSRRLWASPRAGLSPTTSPPPLPWEWGRPSPSRARHRGTLAAADRGQPAAHELAAVPVRHTPDGTGENYQC